MVYSLRKLIVWPQVFSEAITYSNAIEIQCWLYRNGDSNGF